MARNDLDGTTENAAQATGLISIAMTPYQWMRWPLSSWAWCYSGPRPIHCQWRSTMLGLAFLIPRWRSCWVQAFSLWRGVCTRASGAGSIRSWRVTPFGRWCPSHGQPRPEEALQKLWPLSGVGQDLPALGYRSSSVPTWVIMILD